jgi:hypothetical protein
MAIYKTTYPGNTALQQEVWTLTCTEAKAILALLDAPRGSYWHTNLARPLHRARRAKSPTVTVYTAGFSTGEFSNALFNCDIAVTQQA